MRAGETRHFDVVAHFVVVSRQLVDLALKKLFLVIPARAPRQNAADVKVLAQDVAHHCRRSDTFGGRFVMRAASRVNVVVAGIPIVVDELDPALQTKRFAVRFGDRYGDVSLENSIFRSPRISDLVLTGRQPDRFAVMTINLIVEEEVRGESTGSRRINAPALIANDELSRGRLAIRIQNVEANLHRRSAIKQDRNLAAKTQILRPLSDVKCQRCLTRTFVAAEKLNYPIFESQSRELSYERLLVEHIDVHPAIRDVLRLDFKFRCWTAGRSRIDRRGVGAGSLELRGDTRLVVDLDQEYAPALFIQQCGSGSTRDFYTTFGIDVYADEHAMIECLLNGLDGLVVIWLCQRCLESFAFGGREAFAQKVECGHDAANLGLERLGFDIRD